VTSASRNLEIPERKRKPSQRWCNLHAKVFWDSWSLSCFWQPQDRHLSFNIFVKYRFSHLYSVPLHLKKHLPTVSQQWGSLIKVFQTWAVWRLVVCLSLLEWTHLQYWL